MADPHRTAGEPPPPSKIERSVKAMRKTKSKTSLAPEKNSRHTIRTTFTTTKSAFEQDGETVISDEQIVDEINVTSHHQSNQPGQRIGVETRSMRKATSQKLERPQVQTLSRSDQPHAAKTALTPAARVTAPAAQHEVDSVAQHRNPQPMLPTPSAEEQSEITHDPGEASLPTSRNVGDPTTKSPSKPDRAAYIAPQPGPTKQETGLDNDLAFEAAVLKFIKDIEICTTAQIMEHLSTAYPTEMSSPDAVVWFTHWLDAHPACSFLPPASPFSPHTWTLNSAYAQQMSQASQRSTPEHESSQVSVRGAGTAVHQNVPKQGRATTIAEELGLPSERALERRFQRELTQMRKQTASSAMAVLYMDIHRIYEEWYDAEQPARALSSFYPILADTQLPNLRDIVEIFPDRDHWLSDDQVAFSLDYLQQQLGIDSRRSLVTRPQELKQWLPSNGSTARLDEDLAIAEVDNKSLTRWPCQVAADTIDIHLPVSRGSHWQYVRLVFPNEDSERGVIELRDSLAGMLPAEYRAQLLRLARLISHHPLSRHADAEWTLRVPKCPQQKNGDDCGYFMVAAMNRAVLDQQETALDRSSLHVRWGWLRNLYHFLTYILVPQDLTMLNRRRFAAALQLGDQDALDEACENVDADGGGLMFRDDDGYLPSDDDDDDVADDEDESLLVHQIAGSCKGRICQPCYVEGLECDGLLPCGTCRLTGRGGACLRTSGIQFSNRALQVQWEHVLLPSSNLQHEILNRLAGSPATLTELSSIVATHVSVPGDRVSALTREIMLRLQHCVQEIFPEEAEPNGSETEDLPEPAWRRRTGLCQGFSSEQVVALHANPTRSNADDLSRSIDLVLSVVRTSSGYLKNQNHAGKLQLSSANMRAYANRFLQPGVTLEEIHSNDDLFPDGARTGPTQKWMRHVPNPVSSRDNFLPNETADKQVWDVLRALSDVESDRRPIVVLLGIGWDAVTTSATAWHTLQAAFPELDLRLTLAVQRHRVLGGVGRLDAQINAVWLHFSVSVLAELQRCDDSASVWYSERHLQATARKIMDRCRYNGAGKSSSGAIASTEIAEMFHHLRFLAYCDALTFLKDLRGASWRVLGSEHGCLANLSALGSFLSSKGSRSFLADSDTNLEELRCAKCGSIGQQWLRVSASSVSVVCNPGCTDYDPRPIIQEEEDIQTRRNVLQDSGSDSPLSSCLSDCSVILSTDRRFNVESRIAKKRSTKKQKCRDGKCAGAIEYTASGMIAHRREFHARQYKMLPERTPKQLRQCREPDCGRSFVKKFSLDNHMKRHRALLQSYNCVSCGEQFLVAGTLKEHEKLCVSRTLAQKEGKEFEGSFACDFPGCGHKMTKKYNVKSHQQAVHAGHYGFLKQSDLDAPEELRCHAEGCGRGFKKASSLKQHFDQCHANTTDRWPCCPPLSANKSHRARHRKTCHAAHFGKLTPRDLASSVRCPDETCQRGFGDDEKAMDIHFNLAHDPSPEELARRARARRYDRTGPATRVAVEESNQTETHAGQETDMERESSEDEQPIAVHKARVVAAPRRRRLDSEEMSLRETSSSAGILDLSASDDDGGPKSAEDESEASSE